MALRINARLGRYARDMRRKPGEYETRLWAHLRASRLGGFKFRRQDGVLTLILERASALPERQKITHPNPSLGREGL
ncbi:DUF559 domain-containing protein [Sphingobium sp. AN641]|uniref:DUF559 domain-containing protein n=1 Tax=Sphingobium sp. AN641 TaxID=3133443 RepID=UPI0030C2D85A